MTTRVLIIFGSTYGYTEQYATWLAEDLRALPQAPEVETIPASKVTPEQAETFDAFVIAGSDYGGFLNGAPALRKKILPIIAPKKNRTAFFTVSFTGEYSKKLLDKAVAKSYTPDGSWPTRTPTRASSRCSNATRPARLSTSTARPSSRWSRTSPSSSKPSKF